ncbi:MAG: hypothetical protein WAO58_11560 [Fimbriimonadaceae bacterium]
MTFDMDMIIESKRADRAMLAELPNRGEAADARRSAERTLGIRKTGEAWKKSQAERGEV